MKSKLSALALSLLLAGSLAVGASAYDDIELTGTNTPPVIDGKLDDCYMKIHDFYEPKEEEWYDNEDFGHDAQGGAWGTWDKDNFYGYFKIAEEDYFPKNVEHEPPGSTYSSMYLALLATQPVNDDPEDPLYVMQCSFNRSIDDTKEWKYTGSVDERYRDNSGAYAKYETCPFDFEVIHEDGFTCYEVAMPWNQIDRTGKVKFTEGHKWTFNYIISWINESGGYNVVQYGQGLMNDIYDMGGIVTLAAAPASSGTAESSEPAAAGAELLAQSWDTIFVDYEMMVDGGAGAWLADNPVEGDIEDLETRGWAHISTPITAFAYTIDGGDPVQSEDFIQDRPDVKAAIHEEAEGFDIQIEVAGLDAGDHVIKVYAVDANGGLVDTGFDFPFTLIRDEAPAATGAYPASGESGNFMMGKVIGNETGWDGTAASGAASAFDGNPDTFFDPLGVGDGFCGMEYDEPYILEKVAILSRSTFLD
ncbi:MAG: hypothetical protein IIU08_10875, partial [Clostridia bacterium]|nr:hypothetical protein [Clostridia bacterium]